MCAIFQWLYLCLGGGCSIQLSYVGRYGLRDCAARLFYRNWFRLSTAGEELCRRAREDERADDADEEARRVERGFREQVRPQSRRHRAGDHAGQPHGGDHALRVPVLHPRHEPDRCRERDEQQNAEPAAPREDQDQRRDAAGESGQNLQQGLQRPRPRETLVLVQLPREHQQSAADKHEEQPRDQCLTHRRAVRAAGVREHAVEPRVHGVHALRGERSAEHCHHRADGSGGGREDAERDLLFAFRFLQSRLAPERGGEEGERRLRQRDGRHCERAGLDPARAEGDQTPDEERRVPREQEELRGDLGNDFAFLLAPELQFPARGEKHRCRAADQRPRPVSQIMRAHGVRVQPQHGILRAQKGDRRHLLLRGREMFIQALARLLEDLRLRHRPALERGAGGGHGVSAALRGAQIQPFRLGEDAAQRLQIGAVIQRADAVFFRIGVVDRLVVPGREEDAQILQRLRAQLQGRGIAHAALPEAHVRHLPHADGEEQQPRRLDENEQRQQSQPNLRILNFLQRTPSFPKKRLTFHEGEGVRYIQDGIIPRFAALFHTFH